VALQLALQVAGIQRGDDVATVSHSFIATANAVVAVGARPVFVDIAPETLGMDAQMLERALTPSTRAILCVHQVGMPCDLAGILAVARGRGIPVIEDAACAVGSQIRTDSGWERIGRPHGLLACFSFHPRKVITTGDGGMITTADGALAERLRLLRQHAMSLPNTVRHDSARVVFEQFCEPAFNYRMTDLQAAVGRPQLACLDDIVAERRRLADRYAESLAEHPLFTPPREPVWTRSNWQSYALALRPGARGRQVEIMQFLLDRGVASRRGIGNAHAEPAYRHTPWTCGPDSCASTLHDQGRCLRLPACEEARDSTILIPLFHGMSAAEQDHVIASLLDVR
jgi:dTDP-4-amino-4,6-dideoxygalactose transaminase